MWPFSITKLDVKAMYQGLEDVHSHILPGVDDGIADFDESLAAIDRLEGLGVRKLWLTPHIMEDMPNATCHLLKVFEALKQEYSGNIELALGAEYMLDSLFVRRMADGDILPVMDGRHLLVETSTVCPPTNFETLLIEIQKKGYFPLLAHPERYSYMTTDDYHKLADKGVHLQVTIPSLCGAYGRDVAAKARYIYKNGLYQALGTDMHFCDTKLF